MGIEYDLAEVLIRLRSQGVSFNAPLTLGRQNFLCSEKGIQKLFTKYGVKPKVCATPKPYPENYAEDFLYALGASIVYAMDITDAEGAFLVQDLNKPVQVPLHDHFDVVIDAGTLEHVFDVRQAFFNCMRMVKVGGKFVIETPGNNHMGHGFFQFSPELFFSLLSEANGFRVDELRVVELSPFHRKFHVIPPSESRSRFDTTTFWRTNILCVATKVKEVALSVPQQSAYLEAHDVEGHKPWEHHKVTWLERFIVERFPRLAISLKSIKFSALRRSMRLGNRKAFRK